MHQASQAASVPTVLPGQDYLIAQFGAAAVFMLAVVFAVITLWKALKANQEAAEKARRDDAERAADAMERVRAEHAATLTKITTDAFKAMEQSRAEFLAESRRRDDIFESRLNRFEERVLQMTRENNATVQAMHDKADKSAANIAVVLDAIGKRITT